MKPTEDKQTKRYQAEEANCRRQERGNLEMGQYATPSDLVAEDFDGNPILVYQLDRRARIASAALDDYDKSSSKFNGMSGGGSVGYNQSLRVTAAMAAGVTGKLWSLTDMVQVIEDCERVGEDHRGPCCRAKGEIDLCGFS